MSKIAHMQNYIYQELYVGQTAQLCRTVTQSDIESFAAVSGDTNPAHLDPDYAKNTVFHRVIAHGMWLGSLISALLGTQLPGPGTIYLQQELHFKHPVYIGDTLLVRVTVVAKENHNHHIKLACEVINQHKQIVVSGTATVLPPQDKFGIRNASD